MYSKCGLGKENTPLVRRSGMTGGYSKMLNNYKMTSISTT